MRASGILLHITSLPSVYGIGDLGPEAFAMADFLQSCGQRFWQVLPINPTDGINGHSPYSCCSAFAGNPFLISPQGLLNDELLSLKDLGNIPVFSRGSVDYVKAGEFKQKILQVAFGCWVKRKDKDDYESFCREHRFWLDDYALFVVAKEKFKGKCWNEWPLALRCRTPHALRKFVNGHTVAIEQVKFIQYLFYKQWHEFKRHVNSKGVRIIGDIPIYVNYDSADVWCYPEFFKLNEAGNLKFVSGCPPDYFSKTGQRWGNPVYDWANLKKDRYRWWKARIEHNLGLFDRLRIDHFRGFLAFWQIPAQERFAVFGRWVKGPGQDFFKALSNQFKNLPIIAEDLGEITPDVPALMRRFHFPGMRVFLFAFGGDSKTNPHVPANYPSHCVAYTGTHDNNTVQGWYNAEAKPYEKANAAKILGVQKIRTKDIHWVMIRVLLVSKADTVIIPMGDILGLNAEARMNTPATKINNWKWRLEDGMLTKPLARKLFKLTRESGRSS